MRNIWSISLTPKNEKIGEGHKTQKPIELLKRIIIANSDEGDLILDPFNGSGTTGIVAYMLKRKYIGIDNNPDFLDMTLERFETLIDNKEKQEIIESYS